MSSLLGSALPCFVFNFNSRKSKQTLIIFDLQYKINFKNKQAKKIFYLKSKLNQITVIALSDS